MKTDKTRRRLVSVCWRFFLAMGETEITSRVQLQARVWRAILTSITPGVNNWEFVIIYYNLL